MVSINAGVGTGANAGPGPSIDIIYPELFGAADATARSGQRGYIRLARVDLLLLLGGALFSTIAVYAPSGFNVWTFVVAAALLGATTIVKSASKMWGADSTWYDSRAAAEAIKALTWQYMMRASPFDGDDAAAKTQFIASLGSTLDAHPNVRPLAGRAPGKVEEITASMRQIRALPLPERQQYYTERRVDDQISYYMSKAARSHAAAARWFWVDVVARAAALFFAVAVIVLPEHKPSLAGLLSTVAAAATAWSQLNRDADLAKIYGSAEQKLLLLKASLDGEMSEEGFQRLFTGAEATFASESSTWSSKHA